MKTFREYLLEYNNVYKVDQIKHTPFAKAKEIILGEDYECGKYVFDTCNVLFAGMLDRYTDFDELYDDDSSYECLEEAIDWARENIKKDRITVYRGVAASKEEVNKDELGNCWCKTEDGARSFVEENYDTACITVLVATTPVENIEWIMSIALQADVPDEQEIRLIDGQNIEMKQIK